MYLKLLTVVFAFNCMSSVFAQDVKLADLLAEESRKTLAKQREELIKLAPPLPVVTTNQIIPQKIVAPKPMNSEPRTISVYGVSPDYKAEMEINGKVLLVKTGQIIQNYKVASINPTGVMLLSSDKPKRSTKGRSNVARSMGVSSTETYKVTSVKRKNSVITTASAPSVVPRFYPLPQQ